MYDNNRLTVVDAVMQVGFPNENYFHREADSLSLL